MTNTIVSARVPRAVVGLLPQTTELGTVLGMRAVMGLDVDRK
jgi:hypothetical protein